MKCGSWLMIKVLKIMTIVDLIENIAISVTAGAVSGFGVFKLLGKKWVENWFA